MFFTTRSRLKKAERQECISTIRESKAKTLLSMQTLKEVDMAWAMLATDHLSRMQSILRPIERQKLEDAILQELSEGDFSNTIYFEHYSERDLRRLLGEVRGAKRGLNYYETLILSEINKRH